MIFLDGSLGHVLIERSKKKSAGTWSAQFLLKDSHLISEIYDEYIEAGSDIITTNTYSTIPSYLSKAGLEGEMPTLIRRAGELAKNSALKYEGKIKVAGSIPPLDESYRPDLVHNLEQSLEVYEVLIKELHPFVDIYLCETISSVEETKNVLESLKRFNSDKPVWLSWSLEDFNSNKLRSGEGIKAAFLEAEQYNPDAYLFNCTDPDSISKGLIELQKLTDKKIGAYPNVFSVPLGWTLDNNIKNQVRDLSKDAFVEYCMEWKKIGASIFGGCCGIGPDFIKPMTEKLRNISN